MLYTTFEVMQISAQKIEQSPNLYTFLETVPLFRDYYLNELQFRLELKVMAKNFLYDNPKYNDIVIGQTGLFFTKFYEYGKTVERLKEVQTEFIKFFFNNYPQKN